MDVHQNSHVQQLVVVVMLLVCHAPSSVHAAVSITVRTQVTEYIEYDCDGAGDTDNANLNNY